MEDLNYKAIEKAVTLKIEIIILPYICIGN